MSTADTAWTVLPHGPLHTLAENLWWVEGDLPNMRLRRAMVVARLANGELVLHSAIALDEAGMSALEALGRPAWLVVPNGWHRLDAARYKARYPDMKVVCPPDARRHVTQKVPVDATYDELGELPDGAGTVRFETFGAKKRMEGAMIVQSADGITLVFCDSLFNLAHQPGFFWWLYGRVLGSTGGPRVTRIGRLFLTLGGGAATFRAWLEAKARDERVVRLVPGHGEVIQKDARATLSAVAASLA